MEQERITGTVYSETVIWMAPTAFVEEAPYQLAIVDLDAGGRKTARIQGDRVTIGERVELVEVQNGVPAFRKLATSDLVSPA